MKFIESVQNPKVKNWKKLHMKKEREQMQMFLIEGPHLVEEALKSDVGIRELIVLETFIIPKEWDTSGQFITIVSEKVMDAISQTKHPQGVAAVCDYLANERPLKDQNGNYLLIDAVQDPGNLGTMIRTADCAGVSGIILGEGTADLYNDKVIRATQGSLFHLPIVRRELETVIQECKEKNIPVYGTALKGAVDYKTVNKQESFALIVGNEGSGVRPSLLEQTDQNLYVPIYGQAESLNVAIAAGILLYSLRG